MEFRAILRLFAKPPYRRFVVAMVRLCGASFSRRFLFAPYRLLFLIFIMEKGDS